MYRVIIVEDEPEIARVTKSCVEKYPEFQVKAIFSNGQESLNYIWLNPVDLIILDLFMPQMNGKEFLYRLRKENLFADVIVVTADSESESIREVLPFGVVDYLLKPFSADRFSEALERFIQRRRIVNTIGGLDQQAIDAAFSNPAEADAAERRRQLADKGLRAEDYERLRSILAGRPEESFPLDQLAEWMGLSKVTVRRHLNEMIKAREAVSGVETAPGGQPVMRYRLRRGETP